MGAGASMKVIRLRADEAPALARRRFPAMESRLARLRCTLMSTVRACTMPQNVYQYVMVLLTGVFRWYFRFTHVLDLFAFSTIREKFPWPAMRQNSVALSCLLFIGRAVLICHFLFLESPRAVASICPQMACAVSDPSFVDRHELRTLSARSFCCRS